MSKIVIFSDITKREFGQSLVNIISVSFDWALRKGCLIVSLAPLLDNHIGYVVSNSQIKGHLGVENSQFRRYYMVTKREFVRSLGNIISVSFDWALRNI